MTYSSDFLANQDAARNLLLEAGYSSAAAISAVIKIAELCIYVGLVKTLATTHEKGEKIPAYFDAEVDVQPIKLRGSDSVDVVRDLEDKNVLVSRGGKHRVMVSNMMNRIFTICATSGNDSIRQDVGKLHDSENFKDVIDTIEWEMVSLIHENIDLKYLDIESLAENETPEELISTVEQGITSALQLKANGINLDDSSEEMLKAMTKGSEGKNRMSILTDYFSQVQLINETLALEGLHRWEVIRGATSYPQSLLNRSKPPLIKSSWFLKSDFREHPLILKFQDLMKTNQEKITQIVSQYESHIRQMIERISMLDRGVYLLDVIQEHNQEIPTSQDVLELWEAIDKTGNSLKAQTKLLERLVTNMEVLFQEKS
jgi:hypothetical protein